jgi:hypothetical protein
MVEIYGEDSAQNVPPPTPISITVLNAPTGPSREGMPPNLEGLTAQVLFADGTLQVITDTRQFATVPGIMHAEMGFTNVPVRIFFPHNDSVLSGPVIIPTVIPIVIPNGYHITGIAQPQYVDSWMPNFAGLVAEAHYTDGAVRELPLGPENIFWDLMSDHPSNTGTNLPNGINPATGTLFILVSRGPTYAEHKFFVLPLPAIHLVTGIQLEGLYWTTTFYVNDPPTAFTDEHLINSGLTLRITYSSGSSRVITIREFFRAVNWGRAGIVSRPVFNDPSSLFVTLSYYGHLIHIPVPVVNSPRPPP